MVHARNVRPPFAGATLTGIDESSVSDMPGFIRVVSEGNYVAVVCEREEQAIEAAERLEIRWEKPASAPFPASDDLFDYLRSAERVPGSGGRAAAQVQGDPDGALASAATVVEAAYDIPFHGHTAIGPAHALADPSDGQMTIYTNDMKPYSHRTGIAEFLGMPAEQVRVIWMDGPQLYGRTAADDAGFEAAYLARELGRPVRVQWMRHEETAWDTKGPAFAIDLRGGLDADGNVVALDYQGRVANYAHLGYNQARTVLIAQLMGFRPERPSPGGARGPDDMYHIPNRRQETRAVRFPLAFETPLRTGNLRDPNGPQTTFAGESFIDELAAAAGADPVEFRLRLLRGATDDDEAFRRARSIAVVEAAAQAYGWDARPSPGTVGSGRVLTGRGIAYAYRARTTIAVIAEVGGRPRDRPGVGPADGVCPRLRPGDQPEQPREHHPGRTSCTGSAGRSTRRSSSTAKKVTSVDWRTHPTLTHMDAPERIDVVMVNGDPNPDRPDLPPYGAGRALRISRCRRPWRTRSTTRRGCGCGGCRCGRSGCWRSWGRRGCRWEDSHRQGTVLTF